MVIIDHQNGLFSLYGHLKVITPGIDGIEIKQGEHKQIGIMGNTPVLDPPFPVHLHFEIKSRGVLGNESDDTKNFGYTPGHPNWYFFHDPEEYLPEDFIKIPRTVLPINPTPIKILTPALSVRPCPEKDDVDCPSFSFVKQDQRFVAYRRFGDWYEIYLPSYQPPVGCPKGQLGTEPDGPSSGWISVRDPATNEILAVADFSADQLDVVVSDRTSGNFQDIRVRTQPSDSDSVQTITRVWQKPDRNLKQRFVKFETQQGLCEGTVQNWYRIFLSNDPGDIFSDDKTDTVIPSGWVCGKYISLSIVGDLNADGTVNTLDWAIMNAAWFTADPVADLNSDGLVNSLDYGLMNANWGKTSD